MSARDPEDMERLASRIALLASDTGEADNAGRAVGALARKLGLSGGELKQIFLVGLGGDRSRRGAGGEVALDAAEASELRARIGAAETAARAAQRQRDALWIENQTLRAALDRGRTGEQVTRILGALILAASVAGTVLFFFGPSLRPQQAAQRLPADTPFVRAAHVRRAGALVHERPDTSSPVFFQLPAGTQVAVRRLIWNVLLQWAEVEVGGRRGFVMTSEVDLS